MCDTCLSSISASFLLQVHSTYQGILPSSAPKTAVVEIGGTHMSPACHPQTKGRNNTCPQPPQIHGEGASWGRCWEHAAILMAAPAQPSSAGAALDSRHQLLFWQAPGHGCSLPPQDGIFKFYNDKQLTLSLLILIISYSDKQGQV